MSVRLSTNNRVKPPLPSLLFSNACCHKEGMVVILVPSSSIKEQDQVIATRRIYKQDEGMGVCLPPFSVISIKSSSMRFFFSWISYNDLGALIIEILNDTSSMNFINFDNFQIIYLSVEHVYRQVKEHGILYISMRPIEKGSCYMYRHMQQPIH